ESRREFLKNSFRNLTLGGIVLVSGYFGLRKERSAGDENICAIELPCRKCSKYHNCLEPGAVEQKQNQFTK
ncbi:hypothetical protein ACFL4T_08095, partial [candidate division KSB1 bacterium]